MRDSFAVHPESPYFGWAYLKKQFEYKYVFPGEGDAAYDGVSALK
ncbi:MAG: hypothetical protein ABSC47_07350 [Terracidiphilus sp.]|jgi:hypothetical protein